MKGLFRKRVNPIFGKLVDSTKKIGAKIMFRVNFQSLAVNDHFSGTSNNFWGKICDFFPKRARGWGIWRATQYDILMGQIIFSMLLIIF